MGGCDEEVYWALYRLAESMANLGEPWPDVQEAYLKAWEFRPTRAEALHAIAFRYRNEQHYESAYQFAQRAAQTPYPDEDLFVPRYADVYAWRATDEQAVCASWIGRHAEAFTLCRTLLARPDLPDPDRQRIAANRDFSVPAMLEAASVYPATRGVVPGRRARSGRGHCQPDRRARPPDHRADPGLVSQLLPRHVTSRAVRGARYRPVRRRPRQAAQTLRIPRIRPPPIRDKPAPLLAQLRAQIHGRFWLHLGEGWRFFAPENYITRLTAVLDAEPRVFQVGINFSRCGQTHRRHRSRGNLRRAPDAGRYLLTDVIATGPAMFDTTRLDQARGAQHRDPDPPADAGPRTATLDEVLCISGQAL